MIKPSKPQKLKPSEALRIVVVAPDLAVTDTEDDHALSQAKRSRALRIGLLENGFTVTMLDSKKAYYYGQMKNRGTKTDKVDATILLEYGEKESLEFHC